MNPFTLDFSEHKKEVLDSLLEVFGSKFTSLIKDRYEHIYFVPYVNYEGINSYYRFLIACKSRELSLRMLKIIGVNIDKYGVTSFADEFDGELKDICEKMLGGSYAFEPLFQDTPHGFRSFIGKYIDGYSDDYVLEQKINFINAVKGKNTEEVNLDNYLEFVSTDEYKRIEAIAFYFSGIYEILLGTMKEYSESIIEYQDYHKREIERKRKLLEDKRIELYRVLKKGLRGRIKEYIDSLDTEEEKAKALLSSNVEYSSDIEYFNSQYNSMLDSEDTSDISKSYILSNRLKFFRSMGLDVDPWNDNYNEVIQREDVKNTIVYEVFADEITRLRKLYYEQAQELFIKTSEAYRNALAYFGGSEADKNAVYNILSTTQVCVSGGHNQKYKFVPIIYYTIRYWQCGCMDYVLLHEIIHAIQCVSLKNSEHSCGLEPNVDRPEWSCRERNPKKRKYERLNEVITDLIAIEACEYLHKKGIYVLDDKELTLSKIDDFNTSKILKDSVRKFYIRYRKEIFEAGITGDITALTDFIGKENFEEFNDIIDHIDFLVGKGLATKLKEKAEDDELVKEYRELKQRLRKVYRNMDSVYEDRTNLYGCYYYKKRK